MTHSQSGYARYIGRVGALAVALGIGVAIANGAGMASAADDTGTSSASDTASDASSSSESTSSGTDRTSSSTDETDKSSTTASDDTDAGDEHDATGKDAEDAEPERSESAGGSHHDRVTATERDADDDADADTSDSDASADEPSTATVKTVARQAVGTAEEHQPAGETTVGAPVVALSTAAVTDDALTDSPAAPAEAPTLLGLLETLRREIEYRLFNKTPTVRYDSADNTENGDGQVVGRLDAADGDGDVLTYTVLGNPWRGSVSVAADGTFTYTPNAALAATGGSDTFVIAVSDLAGNPAHIHGLSTFLAPYGGAAALARVTVLIDPPETTATSPLATADQIAAEKLATEIVNHPVMQIAKLILKTAWKFSAYQQFAAVGGPDAENLAQLDQAVDEYALQAAFELQLLNPNNPRVIQQVMPPHTWYGQSFGGARILYDNPDTIYRMIPVNNSSSYVLTGRFDGGMPADTTFSVLTGLTGTTTAVLSGKDLVLDADGTSFTITVDARETDPDNPNHLQLPSGATLIAARNTLSDWVNQDPMSLSVERIGGPADNLFSQLGLYDIPVIGPALTGNPLLSALLSIVSPLQDPPLLLRAAETAIVMMLGVIMEPQYMSVATKDAETGAAKGPNELSDPVHNASFLATQVQSAGYFQLADDEALVITINPGNAAYFNVPVTNLWTVTNDYWNEPTSLNNVQATRNTDGETYTIVVSPTDPHVANWVSTGGLNLGTLSIRFQDLSDDPALPDPTVSARVVRIEDLLTEYPELTAQPADATFRAEQRELRRQGYAKRYAPYPLTT